MKPKIIDPLLPPQITIPYVASLSPGMKFVKQASPLANQEKLRSIVENLVIKFNESEELSTSLKDDPRRKQGYTVLRQVDLKDDDGNIMFRCFTYWDDHYKSWHVLMELPSETHFSGEHAQS